MKILISGLHAFEHEGIQNITTLKDQLIDGQHDQSPAILKRHNNVIARWQKLLADSDARKQRLLRMQDQFRQIEELYLTFAKKASAFNSWFENAEEDLTDPVRCNSIEEIRALRDAHAKFQVRHDKHFHFVPIHCTSLKPLIIYRLLSHRLKPISRLSLP